MTRTTYRRILTAAVAWDLAVLVALLVIATYGTLHHETGFYDDGPTPERTLIDLWTLWGFVPAGILSVAVAFASAAVVTRPGQDD